MKVGKHLKNIFVLFFCLIALAFALIGCKRGSIRLAVTGQIMGVIGLFLALACL